MSSTLRTRNRSSGRPHLPALAAAGLTALLLTVACATGTGSAAPTGAGGPAPATAPIPPVGPADTEPKQAGGFPTTAGSRALLTDVRAARHDGFDRVVLEFTGSDTPSYHVAYVEPPVLAAGSGTVVPIAGAAFLRMTLTPASAVDLSGGQPRPTYPGPQRVAPAEGAVITELVRTGDFEATLSWTVGLVEQRPFAVAALPDPPRLVVDVLHGDVTPGRPDGPAALGQRCTGPAGAISFPDGWFTNPGRAVETCTRFAPQPVAPPEGTDVRLAPIVARIVPRPFTELASPLPEEQARAATTVDGRRALRVRQTTSGGLYPDGTPVTAYLVDLGEPGTLRIDAVGLPGFDHVRDVAVLDRMVRTLSFPTG